MLRIGFSVRVGHRYKLKIRVRVKRMVRLRLLVRMKVRVGLGLMFGAGTNLRQKNTHTDFKLCTHDNFIVLPNWVNRPLTL